MTDVALLGELQRLAAEAGIDALGVTDTRPLDAARRAIEERKSRGLHGGMAFTYGRPERSADPARVLEEARSVIVGAMAYSSETDRSSATGRGAVALYVSVDAYGALGHGLEAVADHLRAAGHEAVVIMDDNRSIDRAVAQRAGLGWFGKNTMLLNPELGSWSVLGSVVTTAALPTSDHEIPDGCGTCSQCQKACPTDALGEAGVLDARRCLAWLLQMTGPFPLEYRVALFDRLYGCDECQVVCPVNDRARPAPSSTPLGGSSARSGSVDVVELLGSSDDELMAQFGHWYIPRRRPEYVRRNALVVLGNTGDPAQPATRAAIEAALGHESAMVRGHAVWAARRLGLDRLLDRLVYDAAPEVREELAAPVARRSVAST